MSKRAILLLVLLAQQGTIEAWRTFPISREVKEFPISREIYEFPISRKVDDVRGRFQSSTVEEGRGLQAVTK